MTRFRTIARSNNIRIGESYQNEEQTGMITPITVLRSDGSSYVVNAFTPSTRRIRIFKDADSINKRFLNESFPKALIDYMESKGHAVPSNYRLYGRDGERKDLCITCNSLHLDGSPTKYGEGMMCRRCKFIERVYNKKRMEDPIYYQRSVLFNQKRELSKGVHNWAKKSENINKCYFCQSIVPYADSTNEMYIPVGLNDYGGELRVCDKCAPKRDLTSHHKYEDSCKSCGCVYPITKDEYIFRGLNDINVYAESGDFLCPSCYIDEFGFTERFHDIQCNSCDTANTIDKMSLDSAIEFQEILDSFTCKCEKQLYKGQIYKLGLGAACWMYILREPLPYAATEDLEDPPFQYEYKIMQETQDELGKRYYEDLGSRAGYPSALTATRDGLDNWHDHIKPSLTNPHQQYIF